MYGVVDGVYVCNSERANELNNRISQRNIPSQALEPAFSLRPVSTKYAIMPIVDQRAPANMPLLKYPKYNLEKVFNPGNAQAPWNGFASQINTESALRNQFFALQKADQAYFIPSSNSSLYTSNMAQLPDPPGHAGLFKEENFNYFNPNPQIEIVGNNVFNNNTRVQIKNTTCSNK